MFQVEKFSSKSVAYLHHPPTMASPPSTPPRVQTRAKNADQHPGLAVPKRKRRTKAEMEEDRNRKKIEKEAAEKAKQDKILAAARLENAIEANDKQAAAGIADMKRVVPIPKKAKKSTPAKNPVQKEAEKVSIYFLPYR
jgi:hypothetical protein